MKHCVEIKFNTLTFHAGLPILTQGETFLACTHVTFVLLGAYLTAYFILQLARVNYKIINMVKTETLHISI